MNDLFELAGRAVGIGIGATMVMDGWAALLTRFGVRSLNPAHLGRWLGHLPSGQWIHHSIAEAPAVRGERWLGWAAHYGIGVAFSALLLWTYGVAWARSPSLFPALLIGWVTVTAPLFILQPGIGAGIASRRTSRPVFNTLKSLVTHTVFGVGMYGAALLLNAWL